LARDIAKVASTMNANPSPTRPRLLITGVPPAAVIGHAATRFELTLWREPQPIGDQPRLAAEQQAGAVYHATLDELIAHSDALCVSAPSAPELRGAIDARWLALPRTTLLPHIGSDTAEGRVAMGRMAVDGVASVFGAPPLGRCANPSVLPRAGAAT
jgi:hypothetical protein